jgi:hypothetical protein
MTQLQAYGLLARLYPNLELVLEPYRKIADRPFFARSWLQAVGYIAAGGKKLMKHPMGVRLTDE